MKIRFRRRHLALALCLLPAAIGAYVLLLMLPTAVYIAPPQQAAETAPAPVSVNAAAVNQLHIPKIDVSVPYLTGGPAVLNENAWHRFPERGDPLKGGNFILSGHRFQLGLTPGSTKRKSPFYHINRLAPGDIIYIDFEGTRYEYEVVRRFVVKPHQTEIEAPSQQPKLTLYTCTFKGEADGREVIEARPVTKEEGQV